MHLSPEHDASQHVSLVFIGGGNMARAMIGGLLNEGWQPHHLSVVEPQAAARDKLKAHNEHLGVYANCAGAERAIRLATLIVLAVKPQQMPEALAPLQSMLTSQTVLGIAAGVKLRSISDWLGGYRKLARAMPNTPALVCSGVTGLYAWPEVGEAERELVTSLAEATGICLWMANEADMNAVTAVSGSGPAYAFLLIEAMQQSAEDFGLDCAEARNIAVHTVLGAAKMAMDSTEPLSTLREQVTSRGGTTERALQTMRTHAVPEGIAAGIHAAWRRAREMGELTGSREEESMNKVPAERV